MTASMYLLFLGRVSLLEWSTIWETGNVARTDFQRISATAGGRFAPSIFFELLLAAVVAWLSFSRSSDGSAPCAIICRSGVAVHYRKRKTRQRRRQQQQVTGRRRLSADGATTTQSVTSGIAVRGRGGVREPRTAFPTSAQAGPLFWATVSLATVTLVLDAATLIQAIAFHVDVGFVHPSQQISLSATGASLDLLVTSSDSLQGLGNTLVSDQIRELAVGETLARVFFTLLVVAMFMQFLVNARLVPRWGPIVIGVLATITHVTVLLYVEKNSIAESDCAPAKTPPRNNWFFAFCPCPLLSLFLTVLCTELDRYLAVLFFFLLMMGIVLQIAIRYVGRSVGRSLMSTILPVDVLRLLIRLRDCDRMWLIMLISVFCVVFSVFHPWCMHACMHVARGSPLGTVKLQCWHAYRHFYGHTIAL